MLTASSTVSTKQGAICTLQILTHYFHESVSKLAVLLKYSNFSVRTTLKCSCNHGLINPCSSSLLCDRSQRITINVNVSLAQNLPDAQKSFVSQKLFWNNLSVWEGFFLYRLSFASIFPVFCVCLYSLIDVTHFEKSVPCSPNYFRNCEGSHKMGCFPNHNGSPQWLFTRHCSLFPSKQTYGGKM